VGTLKTRKSEAFGYRLRERFGELKRIEKTLLTLDPLGLKVYDSNSNFSNFIAAQPRNSV
jgi:hypothetical protein